MEAMILDTPNTTSSVTGGMSSYVMSSFAQANVAIRICIAIIAVVANLCTILAFYTDKTLMSTKQSDLIILNLAVTDFGVGLIVAPFAIFTPATGSWPFGEIGCRIYNLITTTLITGGVFSVVALSWDRYLLLTKEYPSYLQMQSRQMILKLIALTWIASLLPGVIENALWNVLKDAIIKLGKPVSFERRCSLPGTSLWQHSLSLGLFFRLAPVIAVIIFGILFLIGLKRRLGVWTKVEVAAMPNEMSTMTSQVGSEERKMTAMAESSTDRNHSANADTALPPAEPNGTSESQSVPVAEKKKVGFQNPEAGQSTAPSNSHGRTSLVAASSQGRISQVGTNKKTNTKAVLHKRYIKPAVVYAVLILSLVVCILPFHAYNTYVNAICSQCFNPKVMNMLINLGQFNSCLNPLLYAFTYKKIRKFYYKLFSMIFKCKCK